MPLKPTKQQAKAMEEEIDLALEEIELTTTNYTQYIITNWNWRTHWNTSSSEVMTTLSANRRLTH